MRTRAPAAARCSPAPAAARLPPLPLLLLLLLLLSPPPSTAASPPTPTPSLLWRYKCDTPIEAAGAFSPDGATFYAGSLGGVLYVTPHASCDITRHASLSRVTCGHSRSLRTQKL